MDRPGDRGDKRQRRFSVIAFGLLAIIFISAIYLTGQSGTAKNIKNNLKTGVSSVSSVSQDTKSVIQNNSPGYYKVTDFVDGDTIKVDMDGTTETVRFIGVDTPETHKPDSPVQCYGQKAANFTSSIIGSQKVRLEADATNQNRDRYGRLLRYVYLPDGTNVDAEIISRGYGFAYVLFPFEKTDEFKSVQAEAKNQNLGLWSACVVHLEGQKEQTNNL